MRNPRLAGRYAKSLLTLSIDQNSLENVYPIGLGPRILRAETAIISAISIWQSYLGDFNELPDFRG